MNLASIMMLAGLVLLEPGVSAAGAAYEAAPYKAVRTAGDFELRDYPARTVVETTPGTNDNGGFMRLFHFIRGRNATGRKIAMTTPVLIAGVETNRTMAFLMPAGLKADAVPQPADGTLRVREWPAGRWAVLRYRGGRNAQREAEALRQLQTWVAAQKLPVLSDPVFGYFNPPWTPPFWRHNEVMLRTGPTP